MNHLLTDNFGRNNNYLRISLTDNCNLRCFYCMPNEDYDFTPASKLMQVDEIEAIAKLFVSFGVNKIRLTGGEPLVRKDAHKIIEKLSNLPVNLTITTNATRIDTHLDTLLASSIRSINVSLDTLQRDKFFFITKRDQFDKVLENINLLLNHNFHVKINMVVMKGINDQEINDFIEWTRDFPIHVRFIEFMPFSGNNWKSDKVLTMNEILNIIQSKYNYNKIQDAKNDTAKNFEIHGHQGTFAMISTMSEAFCGTCNRIRLTADGKLKNCLFSKNETDILTPFRMGEDVVPLIKSCIISKEKALGGQFDNILEKVDSQLIENRSMRTIGG